MRNCVGTCKGICSYNLVYGNASSCIMQLQCSVSSPLQNSVFVVHFSNVFWHWNSPSFATQLIQWCEKMKIRFHSCRHQNQNLSLVSHPYRASSTRVAFVSLLRCKINFLSYRNFIWIPISCCHYNTVYQEHFMLSHTKEEAQLIYHGNIHKVLFYT